MRILQKIQIDLQELNSIPIKMPENKKDNQNHIYYKRDNIKKQINNYCQNDYIKIYDIMKEIYDIIISLNIKIDEDEEYNNNNSNNNLIGNEQKLQYKQQLLSNSEYLEKRGKDLQKIQETAAKINALSETIKAQVYEQGKQIDIIEDNVVQTDLNINKAMLEIEKAKKTEKGSKKKLLCILFWIFFVICAIISLIFIIFKNKKK
jgi:t-SNARE complex subunit (syntaxin)